MRPIRSLVLALAAIPVLVSAYPLDGETYTGIRRLEAMRLVQQQRQTLPRGSMLLREQVLPRGTANLDLLGPDAEFSAKLRSLVAGQSADYAIAVLDFSDPQRPRLGGHQLDYQANVGSVGKLLVMLSWFDRLAMLYPDDVSARERVLRNTQVIADAYVQGDEHKVPMVQADGSIRYRTLQPGDRGNVWEFMDWMLSASSNGAASAVMKQLAALQLMGRDYPGEPGEADRRIDAESAASRGKLMLSAMNESLARNSLDPKRMRQGSLFTSTGKSRMPGTNSYATPRELLKLLALIESEKFVDAWSSREAKRLLYMTQRRIRYASHPVLNDAAVYFKSGSLYSCMPEEGFTCRKYMGNKQNRLASIALVEYPAENPELRYAVAVMSNVLRVNSAVAHQTLALRIHRLIESMHATRHKQADKDLPAAKLEDAEGRSGDD